MEGKKTLMLMAAFILIKKAKTIRKNKKLKMMLPLREKCPYFFTFGQNTERYSVSLRIQSECGKIRSRKNSVFEHFLRSVQACQS